MKYAWNFIIHEKRSALIEVIKKRGGKFMKKVLFSLLFFLFSLSQAYAGMIEWSYSATLSLNSGLDVFGLDGATISTTILFDDTSTWEYGSVNNNILYVKSVSAISSITGAHTISLNSLLPAAGYSASFGNRIYSDTDSDDFFDFIIDGLTFETYRDTSLGNIFADIAPAEDDVISVDNLLPSFGSLIYYSSVLYVGVSDTIYDHTEQLYRVSELATVPEPTTFLLLAIGIVGLAGMRRVRRS